MDYKNPDNKPALEQSVKELLADYQTLFDHMIADPANYKKSALLYYWLRDYKDYLKNENSFDPNYYPDFERGNLVNVNLGFNVGAEMGGLHYAIVLSKSNRRNPNIVIAPLTSVKPGKDLSHLRPTELALGEELFYMFQVKYNALKTSIPTEIKLLQEAVANHSADSDFAQRVEELGKRIELLEKTMKKLRVLKHGSIVVLNQIRTISKMRISDPEDKYDILYGLKISSKNLDAIDERLTALYHKNLDK